MKKVLAIKTVILLFMVCYLTSCVSQSEYDYLLDENMYLSGVLSIVKNEKHDLQNEVVELEDRVSELEDIIDRAKFELEMANYYSDIEYAIVILDEK